MYPKVTSLSKIPNKNNSKKLPSRQANKSFNQKKLQHSQSKKVYQKKQIKNPQESQFGKQTINNKNITFSKFLESAEPYKTAQINKVISNHETTVKKQQKKENIKLIKKKSASSSKPNSPYKKNPKLQASKSPQKKQQNKDLPPIINKNLKIQSIKSDSLVASFCSFEHSMVRKLPFSQQNNDINDCQSNKSQLEQLEKTQLQIMSALLKKNKEQIDDQFKNKIQELEMQISTLKYQLESRNIILNELNAQRNNEDIQDLKIKKQNLDYKIKNLMMEREFLYVQLNQLTQKLERYESQLLQYKGKEHFLESKNSHDKDTQFMIQKLTLELQEERIQNQVLSKLASAHQGQILSLKQENIGLKNQLKNIQYNQPIIINQIVTSKVQSISTSRMKLHSSTVKLNVNDQPSQQEKIALSSLTQYNNSMCDSNLRKRTKKQCTLEQYVTKFSDNTPAKFILVIKILIFFLKNQEKNLHLFYDPKQIIVKGQSKFLQIMSNRSPLRITDFCYLAPQILGKNYKFEQLENQNKQATIWNCALLIDYILNGQCYFKKSCCLDKFEDNYQMKNKEFINFEPILYKMMRKNPSQRMSLANIQPYLNSLINL